ncbi:QVPTGV class sortase B protein-sorting domain-containing protein [uncultured Gemmiger sp.]|uniref:QVPTGV class sortase B protein-sorting domain-containing protein n=1 Tax=uncultured Gemmiger sp. TaxID=1623490 RepID=UPI0025E2D92E|nr:QVPTGV class sortase B protein-sorting domain-containing protein [uncultured Gemmiger sp.]
MKLSKNLGRVATTFLATAMLASVAVVPAFAEGNNSDNGAAGQFTSETFTIQKTLKVPENVYTPASSFTFKIDPATNLTDEETKLGIEKGEADQVTNAEGGSNQATVSFAVDAEENVDVAHDETAKATFKVNLGQFTHAGVYKYTVSEVTGDDGNIKYDTTDLVLYVHIKNAGTNELALELVELVNPNAADGQKKTAGFTNEYGKNQDGDDTLHTLTLTKTIDGAGANMKGEFNFTVKVTNNTDGDAQVFKYWYDSDGNNQVSDDETGYITANAAQATPFVLGNNDKVVIYGLRSGDEYTISEENVTNGMTADNYSVYVGVGEKPTNEGEKDADGQTSGKMSDSDVSVTYLNYRNTIPATGIVMNVAPYALLVVVAAAGCFVFMRKRRED